MAAYRVRIKLTCPEPPTAEQVVALQGGRWQTTASRRGNDLAVTMTITSADVVGALIRALNAVLDQVSGQVQHAEVTATGDEEPTARPPRLRRQPRPSRQPSPGRRPRRP